MSRKKNILLASTCIVLGMALAGPASHAAEEILTAVRSTHQFYLDGEQIQLEAYLINGNNYVKLADVGEALDFNVYWDDAVRIESGAPYTGRASEQVSDLEQTRQDIAALVNQVRREHGLPELAVDQRLMTAAQELSGRKYTWHHNQEECEAVARAGYVALCGTSEQAMLWMLEKDPRLQRVVLCLDHDAAGIEATGRLTDILREHGHTRVSVLRPEYKDWDEDLKALNGRPAQPAEQHPQLQAAELVCARIAVKCMDLKPDGAMQQVPHLFQCYRKCLKEKKLETAMDCMEEIAALSLLVTLRECRQLGTTLTPAQGSQYLQSHILPHQNRMAIRNRTEEISAQLQTALAKSGAPGVRGEAEKREIASAWLELALSCAKVSVKNDADELKAMEKQKQALGMEMG